MQPSELDHRSSIRNSPVVKELPRTGLQVTGPLSVVRLELHAGELTDFIRSIQCPGGAHEYREQTQQATPTHTDLVPSRVANTVGG